MVRPLPGRSGRGSREQDHLPAGIFDADGIVIVDNGKGGAAIAYSELVALAAGRPGGAVVAAGLADVAGLGGVLVEIPGGLPLSEGWAETRGLPFELIVLPNPEDENPMSFLVDGRLRGQRLATSFSGRSAPDVASRLAESPLAGAAGDVRIVEAIDVPILCADCRREAPGAAELRRVVSLPPEAQLLSPVGCPACLHSGFRGSRRLLAAAPRGACERRGPLADPLDAMLAAGEIAIADYLETVGLPVATASAKEEGR